MEFIDSKNWKPVHTLPGYECCIEYYVNEDGDIKSTKGAIEKILKWKTSPLGYPQVNLTQRIGRKKNITVSVHTLVALAFLPVPPMPPGKFKGCCVIKHIDGDKNNCKATNLRWVKLADKKSLK